MAQIHLAYYKGKDIYTEGKDVEQDILNYVTAHNETEYSEIIKSDDRWTVFYHLTDIRKALLSWYPFKNNARVLEIGAGMGALTGLLCEKCGYVAAVELSKVRAQAIFERHRKYNNLDIYVGNVTDIPFENKFDYITLIGVLEYQGNYSSSDTPYLDFLKDIKKFLKPDGKILIAIENKFGIKYWCGVPEDHTGKLFDGINGYPNGGKAKTFDKNELETMIKSSGLGKYKFYYPMPDYKLPQMIFSDQGLPQQNMPHRVIPYYLYYPTLIAREKNLYDDLLRNNVFDFFANSFLVECGTEACQLSNVSIASVTAERKPTHQMATIICDDATVHKIALRKEGTVLLEQSFQNLETLRERGIPCIAETYSPGELQMPYIDAPLLENVMLDALHSNQLDAFFHLVDVYYTHIMTMSDRTVQLNDEIAKAAEKAGVPVESFGPVLKTAYIDLLPHNCFVADGQFMYFDQEFTKENYPARFILFRAFKNLYSFYSWIEAILPFQTVKEKYGLTAIWDVFESIDKSCLEELTDDGISGRLGSYWYIENQTFEKNADFLHNRIPFENSLHSMQAQNMEMQEKMGIIQAEKSSLEERNSCLSEENLSLNAQNSQLTASNAHLISENNIQRDQLLQINLKNNQETEMLRAEIQNKEFSLQMLQDELTAERERLRAEAYNHSAALNAKDAELSAIRNAIHAYYSQAREFEDKYNAINNATFWKMTAPLRKATDFFHRRPTASENLIEEDSATPELPAILPRATSNEHYVRPCPESATSERLPVAELCTILEKYDVVSFDVFDTLVYRGFSSPEDIFSIVGLKIGYLNFRKLRVDAEKEARAISTKANKEIDIYDIYTVLSRYIRIDVEKTIEIEFQTELDYIYANPYMYEVYNQLSNKQTLVYTSDMYWPKNYLDMLLQHCGYEHFENGFVSCEFECGKGNGQLQEIVSTYFCGKKIVHIGDNYQSDILGSQKIGWETVYYKNSNAIGAPHRPEHYDSLVGSVYKSIVNYRLHASDAVLSKDYEHGFIYGGILNCGFCEWLNEFGKNHSIDKLLFLARDCDIISKVYNTHYKEIDNSYVIVSRFAILQITFEDNPEEYIRNFFLTRANLGTQTVEEALKETDLSFLIEKLPPHLKTSTIRLTLETYEEVRTFLYENLMLIVAHFRPAKVAAIQYFKMAIGNARNICLVDLGWGGTILVHMKQFIERHVLPDCKITGTYVAAASNKDTNLYVSSGIMQPFLFSHRQNRDLRIFTDTDQGSVASMFIEALFSSSAATLLKYSLNEDGSIQFIYGHNTSDQQQIEKMQQGILDFAYEFAKVTDVNKEYFNVSAVESFLPLDLIKYDFVYNCKIFKDVKEFEFPLPRIAENQSLTTIGNIVAKKGFI